jgi:hypothetical protein
MACFSLNTLWKVIFKSKHSPYLHYVCSVLICFFSLISVTHKDRTQFVVWCVRCPTVSSASAQGVIQPVIQNMLEVRRQSPAPSCHTATKYSRANQTALSPPKNYAPSTKQIGELHMKPDHRVYKPAYGAYSDNFVIAGLLAVERLATLLCGDR